MLECESLANIMCGEQKSRTENEKQCRPSNNFSFLEKRRTFWVDETKQNNIILLIIIHCSKARSIDNYFHRYNFISNNIILLYNNNYQGKSEIPENTIHVLLQNIDTTHVCYNIISRP
jgi:hypothetical protein